MDKSFKYSGFNISGPVNTIVSSLTVDGTLFSISDSHIIRRIKKKSLIERIKCMCCIKKSQEIEIEKRTIGIFKRQSEIDVGEWLSQRRYDRIHMTKCGENCIEKCIRDIFGIEINSRQTPYLIQAGTTCKLALYSIIHRYITHKEDVERWLQNHGDKVTKIHQQI